VRLCRYIESNISFQERRLRTLKHGHSFAVFDRRGEIVAWSASSDGIYHRHALSVAARAPAQ
jgi:hypothetical protein